MGRILEALSQTVTRCEPATEQPAVPRAFVPEIEAGPEDDAEADMPFIEVGGSRSAVEGSPEVLAAACLRKGPIFQPAPAPVAAAPAPSLRSVMFRPVTADAPAPEPLERRLAAELIAFHQPGHPVSEQYRTVAAALERQPAQVLLWCAPAPGVGATTALLNTAIILAREGKKRIAVIDANLARPAVADRLGLARTPGWREVLAGTVALPSALQATGLPGLTALTAGVTAARSTSRPGEAAVRAVFAQLRPACDLILVDAPCWNETPELIALRAATDAVCLVLGKDQADTPATQELIRTISQTGSRLLGCILTEAA